MKGKEAKKTQQRVVGGPLGESEKAAEKLAALIGKHAMASKKVDAGGARLALFCVDELAIAVEIGSGNKDKDGGTVVPTPAMLWRLHDDDGDSEPQPWTTVYTPPFVAQKILGGANLMAPGVLGVLRQGGGEVPAGAPVAVCVPGNPRPFATGLLASATTVPWVRGKDGEFGEGVAVHVVTCFGDGVWELAGRPIPNEGFRAPTGGAAAHVIGIGAPVAGLGADEDEDDDDDDEDEI